MAKFNDTEGVWIAYDLDSVYEVRLYSEDPVEIIAYVSNRGYGQIAFWPAGIVIDDGIKWWHDHAVDYETQEERLEEGFAKGFRLISWGPDVNGLPGTSIEVVDRENPAENQ